MPLACPWSSPPYKKQQHEDSKVYLRGLRWIMKKCLPFQDLPHRKESSHTNPANVEGSAIYMSPLHEAIGLHFWAYAMFLLDAGASLEDRLSPGHTIINMVTHLQCSECRTFLFQDTQTRRYLPDSLRAKDESVLYRTYFEMAEDVFAYDLVHFADSASTRAPSTAHTGTLGDYYRARGNRDLSIACFEWLLRNHPLPTANDSARRWLVMQAANSSDKTGSHLRLLLDFWRRNGESVPNQAISAFFVASPADFFQLAALRDILDAYPHLDFRQLSPSLTHPMLMPMYRHLAALAGAVILSRLVFSTVCPLVFWIYWGPLWARIPIGITIACGYSVFPLVRMCQEHESYGDFPHSHDWRQQLRLFTNRNPRGRTLAPVLHKRGTWYWTMVAVVLHIILVAVYVCLFLFVVVVFGHFAFRWNPTLSPFSVNAPSDSNFELCNAAGFVKSLDQFDPLNSLPSAF